MAKYLIRLDDASEYMDVYKWKRVEEIFESYGIKPIVGIIPDNQDEQLTGIYEQDNLFWKKVNRWIEKGWIPALHGCEHRYVTTQGGINPVNKKSEFAGLPYEIQAEKIERGWKILKDHGIKAEIFFAPSHTFDENTLQALKDKTEIRVISDTIAFDIYKKDDFWFIPQQSGRARKLPFKIVTFCYHPNTMKEEDYNRLDVFIKKNHKRFIIFDRSVLKLRRFGGVDWILRKIYFLRRKA